MRREQIPEYTNSEIAHLIDEIIHSERDRAILKRRLIDGLCYSELIDEFDVSERCIKNVIYKAQEKLFKHLNPS